MFKGINPERNAGIAQTLFVPFMPGTALLNTYLPAVRLKQRIGALNDLLDIGQVLYELMEDEGCSPDNFHALPQEYQDWIQSLLLQILSRLRNATRPPSSTENGVP